MWQATYYILLAIVIDTIVTLHYRAIAKGWKWLASFLSILITFLTIYVLRNLIIQWDIWLALAYSVGAGAGCFMGMAITPKTRGRNNDSKRAL